MKTIIHLLSGGLDSVTMLYDLKVGVRPNEIWTCYKGGTEPCGKCPACKKLEAACGQ